MLAHFAACHTGNTSNSIELRNGIKFKAVIPDGEVIVYNIHVPIGNWIGFGFNKSMTHAEIFTLETVDNVTTLYDRWSATQDYPEVKEQNNYKLLSVIDDGTHMRYQVSFTL